MNYIRSLLNLFYLDKRNISHTNKRKYTLCHDERKCQTINEFPELSYIADAESLNEGMVIFS